MSHTVHHSSWKHRTTSWASYNDPYYIANRITDRRYSALTLVEAERLGRRPQPIESQHSFATYRWMRAMNDRTFDAYQTAEWRRRRRSDRRALRHAVRRLRLDGAPDAFDVVDDLVLTAPVRDADFEVW